MASDLQSHQGNSRSRPASEHLIDKIHQWFLRHGVPQFIQGYWLADSMPVLFYLLLMVVAFNLAIEPWVRFNPWFLLLAPVGLVILGLSVGLFVKTTIVDEVPYLISELSKEKEQRVNGQPAYMSLKEQVSFLISNPIRVAKLFVGVFVVSWLIFRLGGGIFWNDFTMDFTVIAVLLWSSSRLFRHDVWSRRDAKLRERRQLYVLITVAVVVFAFEGSVLPDATAMMNGVMGTIMPAAVPVPHAFAALLVAVIIVVQSQGLIPVSRDVDGVATQQRFNAYFPAMPLLVLVFCAEAAVLPYVGPKWVAATVPLVAIVGLASLHLPLRRRQDEPTPTDAARRPKWLRRPDWLKTVTNYPSVRRFIDYPGLTALVVLYLVACPLLVGALATADEYQPSVGIVRNSINPRSAVLLAFAINLFYLSLVVGIAVFKLHKVAQWAITEAWTDWRERISNLGRGLSILVVLTALALLTAETWETMRWISTKDYVVLLGSIFGLTGAFHLLISIQQVADSAKFGTWSDVRAAAILEDESPDDDQTASSQNGHSPRNRAVKELLDSDDLSDLAGTAEAPKYPLGGLETVNTVIVMMTYEIFFFIPVTIVAAILFLTLGRIAVPPKIAANWIYGDRATDSEINVVKHLPLIHQPWLRVGLLLTAFSILYLAVQILSDADQRSGFFRSAEKAVRRRLAVRLAYCELLARRGLLQPGPRRPFWHDRHATSAAGRTGDGQPPMTSATQEAERLLEGAIDPHRRRIKLPTTPTNRK